MSKFIHPPFQAKNLPSNFVNIPYLQEHVPDGVIQAEIPEKICDELLFLYKTFGETLYKVGVQGKTSQDFGKGSLRLTNYDVKFANKLERYLKYIGQKLSIELNEYSYVDWKSFNETEDRHWVYEGISPVFRYMEYSKGSQHFPHYDAPHLHRLDPLVRTLYSGVLYLTTNRTGATAFVEDGQDDIPFSDRNLEDWTRQATLSEIKGYMLPKKGKIILFPHQMCHTVLPLIEDEERIIIRFDVYFNARGS